ncbi:matrixin family metalloprotease [Lactobacillus sp. M0398]|uniref:matrixin family metalloprotease n=1 Tax=unclassified Lactobacillus TaxID=2620435 RepID=UPI0018DDA2F8|nr:MULTISPECIES: matrixin family metalloprotease [unclassified Lactobacillus]MBI0121979.1 matrixin family metalloprotease [Lactobacillus sp. M0398]MBI0123855.1 matrixin family metalloprotease [Lactobacillus sp. W8174]MBI0136023.1 matrixin family metalloprotease [Lactobacillus sp. W8173]
MNIPLTTKFIKIAVATLALITTSATVAPTTITNLTTISAKAKKHHKKVKKTKKKTYVIAKYYDEFKPGYSYTYNKKKGVFIGHKKKKHHASTTDSDEPRVEKATSTYDVPKVKEFTKDILNKYHIYDERWAKTTLTFNDSKLTNEQQQIVENAIKQINDLGIVTIKKTNKDASINYVTTINYNTNRLAETRIESSDDYKGLSLIENTTVSIFINKFTNKHNFNLVFNTVILHETGHALGLNHTDQDKYEIMSQTTYEDKIKTTDNIHTTIDQDYINGLAILYQN